MICPRICRLKLYLSTSFIGNIRVLLYNIQIQFGTDTFIFIGNTYALGFR